MTTGGLKHFWYELRDDNGDLRINTPVYVYESVINDVHYPYPASTEVNLYDSTNTTTLNQPISTTSAGILEFYIRDEMWPSGGYGWDDRIRIQWLHNSTNMYADRVMLWGEFYPVDETSANTDLNKAISNALACSINTHIGLDLDAALPSSSSSSSSSESSSSSSSSESSSSSSSSSSVSSSSSSASATTTSFTIGTADDDGYIDNLGSPSYVNNSNQVGASSGGGNWRQGFLRYTVTIPQGSTIVDADLEITVSITSALDTPPNPTFTMYFEDTDNALPYTGDNFNCTVGDKCYDLLTRTLTTWSTTSELPSANGVYNYDVTGGVQEVIDRLGWVSGNKMCLQWRYVDYGDNGGFITSYSGTLTVSYY